LIDDRTDFLYQPGQDIITSTGKKGTFSTRRDLLRCKKDLETKLNNLKEQHKARLDSFAHLICEGERKA